MTFIKNNSYILLIIILCMGFAMIGANQSGKEQLYTEITVIEGDTLWGLASNHAEKTPKDQWIKKVMRLNDLSTATIREGENLLLPTISTVEDNKNTTQLAGDSR